MHTSEEITAIMAKREYDKQQEPYCVATASTQEQSAIQYGNKAEPFFIPQFSK